jgi:prephenate dehydratase/chorismate mutase
MATKKENPIARMRKEPIARMRREIDRIDAQLVGLMNERAALAGALVRHKRQAGLPIFDPTREMEVLARVIRSSKGPLSREALSAIYRQLIAQTRRLEETDKTAKPRGRSLRVAYQGEPGAFSEAAARELIPQAHLVPCATFPELLHAAESGRSDIALLPIANRIAGPVDAGLELLLRSKLTIVDEIVILIRQNLICIPGTKLNELRTVESHPVALAQCARFFSAHRKIKAVNAEDTAGAVREMMLAGDRTRGAIAAAQAAEVYGAEVLKRDVHDRNDNLTRFVALRLKPSAIAADAKVKLTVAIPHRFTKQYASCELPPGITIANAMTHRGHDGEWQIVDLVADVASAKRAAARLRKTVPQTKILGLYPVRTDSKSNRTNKNGAHRNGHHNGASRD